MAIPSFQNIQNKLFPLINKDLVRFMGQSNFVSKHIPEIPVAVSQGAVGADLDNTAYNLRNMYGGTALGHIFNEYPKYQGRFFRLESEEYYIGIDINRVEEMNEIYNTNQKQAGTEIYNYIGQKLVNRLLLLRERNLAKVVTNADFYSTSNTVDLSTKSITTWAEEDIDNFFKSFAELTKYMNYAVGGTLFNDQMELQDTMQKFYIVVPINVYTKLMGIFRQFKNYITVMGTTPDGKYKAFRPDMFNAVTSGITVVASSFKVAEDKEVDPIYQIANLEDLWTENEIYLFTTSSNIMDMSSVKEVVYLSSDIKEMDILGNNLWRTRTKRQTLASNPLAFAKIKLKLTA